LRNGRPRVISRWSRSATGSVSYRAFAPSEFQIYASALILLQRGGKQMPLPLLLGALFGKAAAGAVTKGLGSKAVASGAKAGHRSLVRKLFAQAAQKAVETTVDNALSHKEKKKKRASR
jgi:hypothetical protein